jgi:hypothetical protein
MTEVGLDPRCARHKENPLLEIVTIFDETMFEPVRASGSLGPGTCGTRERGWDRRNLAEVPGKLAQACDETRAPTATSTACEAIDLNSHCCGRTAS